MLSGDTLLSKKLKLDVFFYEKYSHEDFSKFRTEIEYLIGYTV